MRKPAIFLLLLLSVLYSKAQISCNNWLSLPSTPSAVEVGQINITGTQITVEATINRTTPYSGGQIWAGDVVSKHDNPTDANYLLRPNGAEITTSKGYFKTPDICEIELNKNYHLAMVYDGSILKFYRNGFLMSQVQASGTLYQNSWPTRIGYYFNQAYNENFIGYINEVRIWNVAKSQTQIKNFMNNSLPNPTSQTGLVAYYTFDNLLNKQGNAVFNGIINGSAAIKATNQNCLFIADSCLVKCLNPFDFSFQQDACNPLKVNFLNLGDNSQNPVWLFGDGSTVKNDLNPEHIFINPGDYIVKYTISNAGCNDTVTKIVSVKRTNANIIFTKDTTICLGSTKKLQTLAQSKFCWSPVTFLDDPLSANPTTSATQPITYFLSSEIEGTNLITNGDFSQGNTGFTSAYTYSESGIPPSVYFVGTSPYPWHPAMPPCKDHTSGTGNMLLVNGSEELNVKVWSQSVNVQPNTTYNFSAWIQTITTVNPSTLQFSVNGFKLGKPITANVQSCVWDKFSAVWNSSNETVAEISIVNMNPEFSGNDFALDDITFSPVYIQRDSVKINVEKADVKAGNDTLVCSGNSVQLKATNAASYSWAPATGLSNSAAANPVATVDVTTNYIVTGRTPGGCEKKDTIIVSVNPKSVITISSDTSICSAAAIQLFALGGETYVWTPAATLNNNNIASPVASPTSTTQYVVNISDAYSCNYKDSVLVSVKALPQFNVSPAKETCLNTPVQLVASGGDKYVWQPANFLDNNVISNPYASPGVTTNFSVVVTDSVCKISQTLSTTVTVNSLPDIQATSSNDIDCSVSSSQLNAVGGAAYTWFPAVGLNVVSVANPLATPAATTVYFVEGTDNKGCKAADSVSVKVLANNKSNYLMPNSFTPNGDGLNDCFGVKYWGGVIELDFNIYNRYGEKVFHTSNPIACWDGRFKGNLQDANVFVYTITAKTLCGDVKTKGSVNLLR